ncbi:MAG: Asp-tRNA(Asn)/Glu-tRNA(Gln) amidotransferase subunit GatB [Candidatus Brocadiia bacterium]
MDYEIIIGLETHAELLTESKLWCSCSTEFGQPPNTQTCPVCLGMPGVLPVLNERAFKLAIRAAIALNCDINQDTFFDRKNYYYPDLPKNYQISQNYSNLGENGYLEIELEEGPKKIGIWNVHLEEDAGKNIHSEQRHADYSLVDLNRAGTPLLEIVSGPDMRSVREAHSYMHTLRQILRYTEVSDCKMQEGSLRYETSISLREPDAEEFGARVEIKNLNSIKAVTRCLEYEINRQQNVLEEGGTVERETRLWDAEREKSQRMRSKEEAHDYRYFPEPDLVPYHISDEMLQRLRRDVPELPGQRRARFMEEYDLSEYEAEVLTENQEVADYLEGTLEYHDAPKSVANWIMNDILAILNERKISIEEFEISPDRLAELIRLEDEDKITAKAARDVLEKMLETGRDAGSIVAEEGLEAISGADELEPVVEEAMEEAEQAVQDYLNGKDQAVGALIGQVMRLTQGQADPQKARELLLQRLEQLE